MARGRINFDTDIIFESYISGDSVPKTTEEIRKYSRGKAPLKFVSDSIPAGRYKLVELLKGNIPIKGHGISEITAMDKTAI